VKEPRQVQLAAWVECQVLGKFPGDYTGPIIVANIAPKHSIHIHVPKLLTTSIGSRVSPTRSTPTDDSVGTTQDTIMMASYRSTKDSVAPLERITGLGGSSGAIITLRRRTLGIPRAGAEW
jgi:hypothetical protein